MTDDPSDLPVAAAVTVRAPVVPRIGGALGRYELGEVLGQGAMATVFRARDTRLGRQVAVKVMNLAVAARSESGERFRREAQAVAAVKHPGIVEIFDFVAATDIRTGLHRQRADPGADVATVPRCAVAGGCCPSRRR
jgi:hypothetical protein